MMTLWTLLIIVCILITFTHPTKQGFAVCGVFLSTVLLSVFILEVVSIPEGYDYLIYSLSSVLGMICLLGMKHISLLYKVLGILLVQLGINYLGSESWFNYYYIHVNNYLQETIGLAPITYLGELWIYNSVIIAYYMVAAYILYDREGRSKHVGNGALQFIADSFLAPAIGFKGMAKWKGKED
jgi:hypothetical protein